MSVDPNLTLSIVVPTIGNRPQELERLIYQLHIEFQSLGEANQGKVQVALFLNGASDQDYIQAASKFSVFPQFEVYHSKKRLCIGDSFNTAISYCKGEFIWLIGDDDLPSRKSIHNILSAISELSGKNLGLLNLGGLGISSSIGIDPELLSEPTMHFEENGLNAIKSNYFTCASTMSTTVFHSSLFESKSLWAGRQSFEIFPLLRAVVEATSHYGICTLHNFNLQRTTSADNWRGLIAFAISHDFPLCFSLLKKGDTAILPFNISFLMRMFFYASLLRDYAPRYYARILSVTYRGIGNAEFLKQVVHLALSISPRKFILNYLFSKDPTKRYSVENLRRFEEEHFSNA